MDLCPWPLTHSPEAMEIEWGPTTISVTHNVLRPRRDGVCDGSVG